MSVHMRFAIRGLAPLLDLGERVQVLGAEISGDYLDLELEGVTLQVVPGSPTAKTLADAPPAEVTGEYELRADENGGIRRRFTRFKLPAGAPVIPVGEGTVPVDAATGEPLEPEPGEVVGTEETTPPSGPGSRGGKAGS
jgi:hypothetical protein